MGRLISNMLPRYSATVLALIMVACVMFDIGDGADTAGLEVVDVANAQHHDVATAQRHVAGAPDPTTKEEATAQLGSAKGKKAGAAKRGSAKGKKAGAAKKKPAKAQGKKSTMQKATAAFKLRLAQKESAKSSAGDCKNLCDSKCGKELEMDEVVALIEIDEERGGASSLAGKQRDANEQQKLDSPGGDEKATAKAQKKQNAKKAETDQVDKALKHAQVIKDKVMRDEAIAATASAQAVAIVKDKAAEKRKAVKEATAQAESEAAIAQGKMLQARMAKKEAKLKRSHEADEQKKLIDREVAANREVSKDATKKKAAEKKAAEADANAASVQKYADRKVSDTKLKQDNQIEKIMQKAEAKVKIMHSETAGYKKKSAVLDDRLKAVDGSAKSDALKKVEIAKLSDPKSPKNVALARIAKAKKKSQKAQDKLITQTKVKMAVKTLEKQQANAVDADKQAKKVDAQKAKLKKNQADTAKEKAVGKAAAKKVAKDKTKMAKAMKKGTCKAACKAKCKADSKAKKTA